MRVIYENCPAGLRREVMDWYRYRLDLVNYDFEIKFTSPFRFVLTLKEDFNDEATPGSLAEDLRELASWSDDLCGEYGLTCTLTQ